MWQNPFGTRNPIRSNKSSRQRYNSSNTAIWKLLSTRGVEWSQSVETGLEGLYEVCPPLLGRDWSNGPVRCWRSSLAPICITKCCKTKRNVFSKHNFCCECESIADRLSEIVREQCHANSFAETVREQRRADSFDPMGMADTSNTGSIWPIDTLGNVWESMEHRTPSWSYTYTHIVSVRCFNPAICDLLKPFGNTFARDTQHMVYEKQEAGSTLVVSDPIWL